VHHRGHDHGPAAGSSAFAVGICLNLTFIVFEVVFGLRSRSLALLSDAGHNFGDVLGLALAWGALLLGRLPPTARHTYGLRRASILASLGNAILLLVVVGGIAREALGRLGNPEPVAGGTVMVVAAIGVLVNGGTALMFLSGRKRDLNVRGAFLHMASDAAVSLGVVITGLLMARTGWAWLDPAVSLGLGVVIIAGTWRLLWESFNLAMDAVPEGVDLEAVEHYLTSLPGIAAIHDLHVWGMSTTETALTVHLVKPGAEVDDALIGRICHELHARFGIEHTTIQLERSDRHCQQAPADTV
jgi:cobalt-zinc-cadmium efflux system protein